MFKTDADIIIFAYIVYYAAIILFSWMTIMSVRTIIAYLRAGKTITLTDDMLILPVNNILGASRYYHIPYARISHKKNLFFAYMRTSRKAASLPKRNTL